METGCKPPKPPLAKVSEGGICWEARGERSKGAAPADRTGPDRMVGANRPAARAGPPADAHARASQSARDPEPEGRVRRPRVAGAARVSEPVPLGPSRPCAGHASIGCCRSRCLAAASCSVPPDTARDTARGGLAGRRTHGGLRQAGRSAVRHHSGHHPEPSSPRQDLGSPPVLPQVRLQPHPPSGRSLAACRPLPSSLPSAGAVSFRCERPTPRWCLKPQEKGPSRRSKTPQTSRTVTANLGEH